MISVTQEIFTLQKVIPDSLKNQCLTLPFLFILTFCVQPTLKGWVNTLFQWENKNNLLSLNFIKKQALPLV